MKPVSINFLRTFGWEAALGCFLTFGSGTTVRSTLLVSSVRSGAHARPAAYNGAQVKLTRRNAPDALMTATRRWLTLTLSIGAACSALAAPAGAQFASGHSAFDQRLGPKPV